MYTRAAGGCSRRGLVEPVIAPSVSVVVDVRLVGVGGVKRLTRGVPRVRLRVLGVSKDGLVHRRAPLGITVAGRALPNDLRDEAGRPAENLVENDLEVMDLVGVKVQV
jgi:hypothetical protein